MTTRVSKPMSMTSKALPVACQLATPSTAAMPAVVRTINTSPRIRSRRMRPSRLSSSGDSGTRTQVASG